jgi:16S rRNA (adenine1518-N6/adenine1519-N6)-dimethyltransferase
MPDNPYLQPAHVRAALRTLNLRPTRGMGQNFLVDAPTLASIVDAAQLSHDDLVVEVGPGLGVLTWELIHHAGQVLSVELDKRLAARLQAEFAHHQYTAAPLTIVQADILKTPPDALFAQARIASHRPYKVVANLPYAITSPVLRHFLEHHPQPSILIVLVQWEVAQRICAAPGSLSMLAHAIQMYATPTIIARIPPQSFLPPPAVDSAILRLDVRPAPVVSVDDDAALFRIMKAGFLHTRKKLSNALPNGLAAMGEAIPRETIIAALEQAGVSPDRRAETVTLEEWAGVYAALRRG